MAARPFGQLGVEITQHQTASPSDAMVDEVLAALTQYRAVVLRHQTGGDGDLVRFLARLGELVDFRLDLTL